MGKTWKTAVSKDCSLSLHLLRKKIGQSLRRLPTVNAQKIRKPLSFFFLSQIKCRLLGGNLQKKLVRKENRKYTDQAVPLEAV